MAQRYLASYDVLRAVLVLCTVGQASPLMRAWQRQQTHGSLPPQPATLLKRPFLSRASVLCTTVHPVRGWTPVTSAWARYHHETFLLARFWSLCLKIRYSSDAVIISISHVPGVFVTTRALGALPCRLCAEAKDTVEVHRSPSLPSCGQQGQDGEDAARDCPLAEYEARSSFLLSEGERHLLQFVNPTCQSRRPPSSL